MSFTTTTDRVGPNTITTFPQSIPVTFPFQQASDLVVYNLGPTAAPNYPALVLTINSDYTVTGGGYDASNNMLTGAISVLSGGAGALDVDDQIVIVRRPPENQQTSFLTTGLLTAAMIEQMGDKLATLIIALRDGVDRSLRLPISEGTVLAMEKDDRANKFVGFDADGNLVFVAGGSVVVGATIVLGTAGEITVTPDLPNNTYTISLPAILAFAGKTINGGTFNVTELNGPIGVTTPAAGEFTIVAAEQVVVNGASSMSLQLQPNYSVAADQALYLTGTNVNLVVVLNGGSAVARFAPSGITAVNLSGTNTGDQTSVPGNAGTATALQTARTIGGSSFNGTANVVDFPAPGPIGGLTPNTGVFTTLNLTSNANIRTTKGNLHLELNVKDFGAIGDGIVNDYAALNLAAAALPANYGNLVFPAGKYLTTGAVDITGKSNLLVSGAGAELFASCAAIVISSLTHVTTTATATTAAPHGYTSGDSVSVRGANEGDYNGSFTITVTGASTFTYVMGADPGANATGTLKAQANVQTMVIDETSAFVSVQGLHFNSNATIRGDGIHLRSSASNSKFESCTFEKSSGFGLFIGGAGVTSYITNNLVDSCNFLNTIGDGFHAGGVDGLEIDGCTFDGTGDDSIGIIGYEAYAGVNLNVIISGCVIQNMQNAGGGSGAGIRINMCNGFEVSDCLFDNIAGPAVRISDDGSGHTSVYNEEGLVDNIVVKNCLIGLEAYFFARCNFSRIRTINCTAVSIADWQGFNTVSECVAYGQGVSSITVYVPPAASFSGRTFAANWEDLAVMNCSGSSSIGDNLNCLLYMDTNAACDVGKLIVTGNSAILPGGAAWIVYKGISAGGEGKIYNNTNSGNTTITNAGGTAATTGNNN